MRCNYDGREYGVASAVRYVRRLLCVSQHTIDRMIDVNQSRKGLHNVVVFAFRNGTASE